MQCGKINLERTWHYTNLTKSSSWTERLLDTSSFNTAFFSFFSRYEISPTTKVKTHLKKKFSICQEIVISSNRNIFFKFDFRIESVDVWCVNTTMIKKLQVHGSGTNDWRNKTAENLMLAFFVIFHREIVSGRYIRSSFSCTDALLHSMFYIFSRFCHFFPIFSCYMYLPLLKSIAISKFTPIRRKEKY